MPLVDLKLKTIKAIQTLESGERSQPADNTLDENADGQLSEDKSSFVEAFAVLEDIVYSNSDDDDDLINLPTLDEINESSLVSFSIANYLTNLEKNHCSKVSRKIFDDTQKWIKESFMKFTNCNFSYHKNSVECLVRAIRLALMVKFPAFPENGLQCLPQVSIYIAENFPLGLVQKSCHIVGLPIKCIKVIKCCTNPIGTFDSIDCTILRDAINQDISSNEVPLLCIANMGTNFLGQIDDVVTLREISNEFRMWLHFSGNASAAFVNLPESIELNVICDSMEVQLDSWLGITNANNILLYKTVNVIADLDLLFESDSLIAHKLKSSLNLWFILQSCGKNLVLEKVLHKFSMVNHMYNFVNRPGIRVLSRKPPSVLNIMANNIMETAVTTVVFQFDGWMEPDPSIASKSNEDPIQDKIIRNTIEKINNSSYYDKLNNWLFQILARDFPQIRLENIDHSIYGTCLRFCPFDSAGYDTPPLETFEQFAVFFECQIDILRATVKQKPEFIEMVEKNPVLRLVELNDWAGLGGVLYIPEGWETLCTDQAKTELNKLNLTLVETLKNADQAFSVGESSEGFICVRFGMITWDTDLAELLDLVVSAGRAEQENSKLLDTFSELVKKGIEKATMDLQRETEEKIWKDGLLRHVPVFGSLVNWFSPITNETGIKGRSLNLQEGTVESTENIYKYHMVQAPTGHSRNASESSNLSASNNK